MAKAPATAVVETGKSGTPYPTISSVVNNANNENDPNAVRVTLRYGRYWMVKGGSGLHQSRGGSGLDIYLVPGGAAHKESWYGSVLETRPEYNYKFIGGGVEPRFLYIWIEKNGTLRATMAYGLQTFFM